MISGMRRISGTKVIEVQGKYTTRKMFLWGKEEKNFLWMNRKILLDLHP